MVLCHPDECVVLWLLLPPNAGPVPGIMRPAVHRNQRVADCFPGGGSRPAVGVAGRGAISRPICSADPGADPSADPGADLNPGHGWSGHRDPDPCPEYAAAIADAHCLRTNHHGPGHVGPDHPGPDHPGPDHPGSDAGPDHARANNAVPNHFGPDPTAAAAADVAEQ